MSSEPKLTNSTVTAGISVFHQSMGKSAEMFAGGKTEEMPPVEAEGFEEGPVSLTLAGRIGIDMVKVYPNAIHQELAEAVRVTHRSSDQQKAAIEKVITARLQEASNNINSERHAAWFQARHDGAMTRTVRDVIGDDVDCHYDAKGFLVKVRRKA